MLFCKCSLEPSRRLSDGSSATNMMQDCPTSRNRSCELCFDDLCDVQELDPDQPVDAVGVVLWRARLPWPYLLEAQVVSHQPILPVYLYRHGSILDFSHCLVYRFQDCATRSHVYLWHLCSAQSVCLPE